METNQNKKKQTKEKSQEKHRGPETDMFVSKRKQ